MVNNISLNGHKVPLINQDALEKIAFDNSQPVSNICCVCGIIIQMMAFKNTGVCSELHRKDRDNDHLPFRGGSLAP